MAHMPTWNGEAVDSKEIMEVNRQSFELLMNFMAGGSIGRYSKEELLHITEAASLVGAMTDYAKSTALPLAKARGASLAELSAATGLPRSTLQTKRYTDLYAEWSDYAAGPTD